jgi:hypothetical protein
LNLAAKYSIKKVAGGFSPSKGVHWPVFALALGLGATADALKPAE